MRMKSLKKFLIMPLFLLLVYQSPVCAGGTTAQAGRAQAQNSALSWKADAALVQISTQSGSMIGIGETWSFLFHSPQAQMCYEVDVKDGNVDQTREVSSSLIDAVEGDFIDSDQAIAEAQKKGMKGKNRAMMTLQIMLQGTKSQGAYWNIVSDRAEGRSTLIHAKTGKFFRHQALK